MLAFYKKAVTSSAVLLVFAAITGWWSVERTFLHSELLPAERSLHPWRVAADTDAAQGGLSSMQVHDDRFSLNFNFNVSQKAEYPYTALAMVFADTEDIENFLDLSAYSSLSFSVKCQPANVLSFVLFTIDEQVTEAADLSTYRLPTTFFSCGPQWTDIEIDLTRLETPQWWFGKYGLELSRQEYRLDKIPRWTFGNSFQSPFNMDSQVQLDGLTLRGRDWRYMYAFTAMMLVLWGGLGFWLVSLHTRTLVAGLKEKLQKDRPLIAYQQLSLEPQKDKTRHALLRYMATEYANPDLNMESVVDSLAVTRNKINDILKQELGYTFSAYLNKLRLTEAARLLAEKGEANIAEIAYSVGYRNVSYFNKLFKLEYGCTPKTFKNTYNSQAFD